MRLKGDGWLWRALNLPPHQHPDPCPVLLPIPRAPKLPVPFPCSPELPVPSNSCLLLSDLGMPLFCPHRTNPTRARRTQITRDKISDIRLPVWPQFTLDHIPESRYGPRMMARRATGSHCPGPEPCRRGTSLQLFVL